MGGDLAERAFFYGRYSHEDSTDKSIADQEASCMRYAASIGATIERRYTDHALSGATMFNRRGLNTLLTELEHERPSLLIVDHLDRLTRDEGDMAVIFRQLAFNGIVLHSVAHGKVDRNTAAILAIVGRNQLESTGHAVKRGQQGQVRAGKSAGGRPYGYLLVGRNGELQPDEGDAMQPGEAVIVRRIFKERLEGRSPRDIAARLNAECIPAPRGKRWNASTLNGSRSRRNGILRNAIYHGIREWNRVSMVRHPQTGKRISRPNDDDAVVRIEVPELAIVSSCDFEAVQRLFPKDREVRPERFRRAKTLLSGLLQCGCCGGGLSMKDKSNGRIRVQCSTMKESRSCDNRSAFYLDELVEAAFGGLRQHLKQPDLIVEVVKAYNVERTRLAEDTVEQVRILEKKLGILRAREKRVWDDYDAGMFGAEIANPRLADIRAEIKAIEAELVALPPLPENVAVHPGAIKEFARYVEELLQTFHIQITDENREAAEAARKLVQKVVVTPTDTGTEVEVFGAVGLLVEATKDLSDSNDNRLGGMVVAEEGLEPPTRGL
ncbi:recombinase family protein [Pannonibacter sp. SL95]|uniref:recombinase family protein n=1 Tax=Pannonibacter sp. SL95 TaxID=2995153 RepID=UPI003FA384AF